MAIYTDAPTPENPLLHLIMWVFLLNFTAVTLASQPLTTVSIESQSAQKSIPITFGQIFTKGDVPRGQTVAAQLKNGLPLPLQVDPKATYSDGSLRHAILSTQIDLAGTDKRQNIQLVNSTAPSSGNPINPAELLKSAFKAKITLQIKGIEYTASATKALKKGDFKTWLQGPICTEWLVKAPFTSIAGFEHPHLMGYFNIRAYRGLKQIRVSTIVENNWTYQAKPGSITYDAYTSIGNDIVYAKLGLTHYHHARWRKVFWWGGPAPDTHISHDTQYLIASGAIPNYDLRLNVPVKTLFEIKEQWRQAKKDPMQIGFAMAYMPTTGAHPDIGPLPRWTVRYLLSMNRFAKQAALGTDELAGSWGIHYRDKKTGLPISIETYPKISTHPNMYGKGPHPLPICKGDCKLPHAADTAHQPSFSYVPYMVTGDYYHLEELHFWANWNMLGTGPSNRNYQQGLIRWQQVRGQAWSLRTLGYAAYITPDQHPMKNYFLKRVDHNLDYYNRTYAHNNQANKFHIIDNRIIHNQRNKLKWWMDDFFTWASKQLVDLDFSKARPIYQWKAQAPIARLTDPDYCWVFASIYQLNIRDDKTGSLYRTMKELYQKNFPPAVTSLPCGTSAMIAANNLSSGAMGKLSKPGEMVGYSQSATGFPSNMQPAIAAAADSGLPNAEKAWQVFDSRTIKPFYNDFPNWAIIPRNVHANIPSTFIGKTR